MREFAQFEIFISAQNKVIIDYFVNLLLDQHSKDHNSCYNGGKTSLIRYSQSLMVGRIVPPLSFQVLSFTLIICRLRGSLVY